MERPDSAVIAASLQDPAAFGVLFDRHGAALLRFLARRVVPSDAEGLLGEVFRIAFEKRSGFEQDRLSARPWLYGIATNLVAKHHRSEARRLRATARLAARQTLAEDPAERAVPAADARVRLDQVVAAIAALPDAERQALLLFAWEELSYDEIADALKVPVGTVRSRLNRARARLAGSDRAEQPQTTVSCNRKPRL
ncbi:MAG: sigma-70 family RNA polymerase sigma factor [Acidimicrobiaceae bacterium]|nr:sigma-70 family RNA polymerase sigma factor [Acidimicrobiaceae bacterium]